MTKNSLKYMKIYMVKINTIFQTSSWQIHINAYMHTHASAHSAVSYCLSSSIAVIAKNSQEQMTG